MTPRPPNPGKVVSWSAAVEPPKVEPRVVSWSGQLPPGAMKPPVRKPSTSKPQPIVDDTPVRRKRKSLLPQAILAVVIFSLPVAGAVFWYLKNQRSEVQQRDDAAQSYRDGRWADAQQQYEQLLRTYPEATTVAKDRFYAQLSATRVVVHSDVCKTNPEPARLQFVGLLENYKDSPLVSANPALGDELVKTGHALAELYKQLATDQLESHRNNRSYVRVFDDMPANVDQARKLLTSIERFRGPTAPSSEPIIKNLASLERELSVEKVRFDVVEKVRKRWQQSLPAYSVVDEMKNILHDAGIYGNPDAMDIVRSAENTLKKLAKFEPGYSWHAAPTKWIEPRIPIVAGARNDTRKSGTRIPCFNNGTLLALDELTGRCHWSMSATLPVTPIERGWLVPNGSELQWVDLLMGKPYWREVFHASIVCSPVIVNDQLVIPLADAAGTLVFMDLKRTKIVGTISLRDPIHSLNVSNGRLYVAAIGQRVHELAHGSDGWSVEVWLTRHPTGSLLAPIQVQSRTFALTHARGPDQTAIRFLLSLSKDHELQIVKETILKGWCSYSSSPWVVTDAGDVAKFGETLTDVKVFPSVDPRTTVVSGSKGVVYWPERDGLSAWNAPANSPIWQISINIASGNQLLVGETGLYYYRPLRGPAIPLFNPMR